MLGSCRTTAIGCSLKFALLFPALLLPLFARAEDLPPQAFQHGARANDGLQCVFLFDTGNKRDVSDGCRAASTLRFTGRFLVTNPGVYGSFDPPAPGASPKNIDNSIPCIQFDAWLEKLPSDVAESVTAELSNIERTDSKMSAQRRVRDNLGQVFVSYSVTVEKLPEAGAYRVSFGDSSTPPPTDLRPNEQWKIAAPPQYPLPQIVRDGDEIRLPLYSASGRAELVDYIHTGRPDRMARRNDAAHDAYSLDAAFTLARPSLTVNGITVPSGNVPAMLSGETPWVYVPGFGRFILSFAPHPGLEWTGEVHGQLATITSGGNLLRIHSAERIAAGDAVYNLYGTLDATLVPADPKDRDHFMAGVMPKMPSSTKQ